MVMSLSLIIPVLPSVGWIRRPEDRWYRSSQHANSSSMRSADSILPVGHLHGVGAAANVAGRKHRSACNQARVNLKPVVVGVA